MKKAAVAAVWALFLLYCLLMGWLLFIRGRHYMLSHCMENELYMELLRGTTNLRPFRTITGFLKTLAEGGGYFARHAFVNLAGNVVMFVPLGLFLPLLFRRMRRFRRFFLACALAIVLVEACQALLLVGSADVDDLILNLTGASLGYPLGLLAVRMLYKGEIKS